MRHPRRVTQHPETPGAADPPQATHGQRQEGFAEEMVITCYYAFPRHLLLMNVQDRTGGDWDMQVTAVLSHSCNPFSLWEGDASETTPGRAFAVSPPLHCFSLRFCHPDMGGLCQPRSHPFVSPVGETTGIRSLTFIHLHYTKLRSLPSASAASCIQ